MPNKRQVITWINDDPCQTLFQILDCTFSFKRHLRTGLFNVKLWLCTHVVIGFLGNYSLHYSDVIMCAMMSQITGVASVCSAVCSGADQRKHQSSASLAFMRGIQWWLVDSPLKGSVTQKMFPFDDVIMEMKGHTYLRFILISSNLKTAFWILSLRQFLAQTNSQYLFCF